MILAFDTYYFENKAKTVCLGFKDWGCEENYEIYSETLTGIKDYVSGEFYKRELPCILSLLSKIELKEVDLIIIDGFVFLNDENKLGLGAHLYKALHEEIPIIGVAKRDFATIEKNRKKIHRGMSKNALFITSVGIDLNFASKKIEEMAGEYRIPRLLKELDKLTKGNSQ